MDVTTLFPALSGPTDSRVRRYLTPKRILSLQGDVTGSENLLLPSNGQAALGGLPVPVCRLANKPGQPRARMLLDFGQEFTGCVRLVTGGCVRAATADNAVTNRVDLRIRTGESATEALTPLGERNTTNDHAVRDRAANLGFLCTHETNESAFRFVCLELEEEEGSLELQGLQGVFCYRDLDYLGSFESDDEELNRIWQTAAYTVHLNMQEHLWDGVKRDRLVWIGDMHTEVLTILSVFGRQEVVERSLDLMRQRTKPGGWMNDISSYSFWWLAIQRDWYRSFGDLDFLQKQKPYLLDVMDKFCGCVGEDGSEHLPEWRFMDWPNNGKVQATHAGLQGLLYMALEYGAELLETVGEPEFAARCRARRELLRGHVPSPDGSKQAAALLALSGLADAGEINEQWLVPGGPKGYSTFFGYYLLDAKAAAGDLDGALADLKAYWGGMLKMGATTFWEDFDLAWAENAAPLDALEHDGKDDIHADFGAFCYEKLRHSLCHGWSSGPCPWLSKYVLGVELMDVDHVRVKPHLGYLNEVKGSFPTKHGVIRLHHRKQADGSVVSDIELPAGLTRVD